MKGLGELFHCIPVSGLTLFSIIECSQSSPLPINLQEPAFVKKPAKRFATETRLIHTHCRPWLLVFKGHPHRSVLTLYERFFPGIEMLKIVVDSGIFQLADIANIRGIKGPPEATVVVNKLATYLLEKKTEKGRSWDPDRLAVPHLRYLRLDGHGGIDPPSPGRITSTVRATATSGFQYFREEWSYYGDDEDLSEAEAYCVSLLSIAVLQLTLASYTNSPCPTTHGSSSPRSESMSASERARSRTNCSSTRPRPFRLGTTFSPISLKTCPNAISQ